MRNCAVNAPASDLTARYTAQGLPDAWLSTSEIPITGSVSNSAVDSFGENRRQREQNTLGDPEAGQQVWLEKPAILGPCRPRRDCSHGA